VNFNGAISPLKIYMKVLISGFDPFGGEPINFQIIFLEQIL